MAKPSRKSAVSKHGRVKSSSVLPLSITAGLFLGFGLGAMMGSALWVTLAGIVAGTAIGYRIDRSNKITYTHGRSKKG